MRACLLVLSLLIPSVVQVHAADFMNKVHFMIPAGPGGGWDGTARGVGLALNEANLTGHTTFENIFHQSAAFREPEYFW